MSRRATRGPDRQPDPEGGPHAIGIRVLARRDHRWRLRAGPIQRGIPGVARARGWHRGLMSSARDGGHEHRLLGYRVPLRKVVRHHEPSQAFGAGARGAGRVRPRAGVGRRLAGADARRGAGATAG